MAGFPDQERLDKKLDELAAQEGKSFGMGRLGFDFGATVLACAFAGWLLDREFAMQPWGLVAMTIVGFIAGIANVWRGLRMYDEARKTER